MSEKENFHFACKVSVRRPKDASGGKEIDRTVDVSQVSLVFDSSCAARTWSKKERAPPPWDIQTPSTPITRPPTPCTTGKEREKEKEREREREREREKEKEAN